MNHLSRLSAVFALAVSLWTWQAYAHSGEAREGYLSEQSEQTCSGVVKDPQGVPVIGASVLIKGTMTGAVTGSDGTFVLDDAKNGDVLQISCIGYKSVEVTWGGESAICNS